MQRLPSTTQGLRELRPPCLTIWPARWVRGWLVCVLHTTSSIIPCLSSGALSMVCTCKLVLTRICSGHACKWPGLNTLLPSLSCLQVKKPGPHVMKCLYAFLPQICVHPHTQDVCLLLATLKHLVSLPAAARRTACVRKPPPSASHTCMPMSELVPSSAIKSITCQTAKQLYWKHLVSL